MSKHDSPSDTTTDNIEESTPTETSQVLTVLNKTIHHEDRCFRCHYTDLFKEIDKWANYELTCSKDYPVTTPLLLAVLESKAQIPGIRLNQTREHRIFVPISAVPESHSSEDKSVTEIIYKEWGAKQWKREQTPYHQLWS